MSQFSRNFPQFSHNFPQFSRNFSQWVLTPPPRPQFPPPPALDTWCPIFLTNTWGGDHCRSWLFPLCMMSNVKGR